MTSKNQRSFHALSVRQPWATALVSGEKRVENRKFQLSEAYIGRWLMIQASKTFDKKEMKKANWATLSKEKKAEIEKSLGKIVGMVKFTKCTRNFEEAKLADEVYARRSKFYWLVGEAKQFSVLIPHRGNVRIHPISNKQTRERIEQIMDDE